MKLIKYLPFIFPSFALANPNPELLNFAIPRDENHKPIYKEIEKGFYKNDTYIVQKGDSLFLIAYIAGKDINEIAALNNLTPPYALYTGQKIIVQPAQQTPAITYRNHRELAKADNQVDRKTYKNKLTWFFPTQGKIIEDFSLRDNGNKGWDIAGKAGQPIFSAADGEVVYAGNTLRGYGNLIIIRHPENFLTAYAHNDQVFVKHGQSVRGGEQIATLGNTEANQHKLHFEIRYLGKAVDPNKYLVKR